MRNQRGFVPILIILLILTTIGGFLLYSGKINLKQNTQQNLITQPTPSPNTDETVSWKTYTNTLYQIKFKYPENWILKESSYTKQEGFLFAVKVSSPNYKSFIDITIAPDINQDVEKFSDNKDVKKTKVGEINAWEQSAGENTKLILLPSVIKDQIIMITFIPDTSGTEIQSMNQILSTFKYP